GDSCDPKREKRTAALLRRCPVSETHPPLASSERGENPFSRLPSTSSRGVSKAIILRTLVVARQPVSAFAPRSWVGFSLAAVVDWRVKTAGSAVSRREIVTDHLVVRTRSLRFMTRSLRQSTASGVRNVLTNCALYKL